MVTAETAVALERGWDMVERGYILCSPKEEFWRFHHVEVKAWITETALQSSRLDVPSKRLMAYRAGFPASSPLVPADAWPTPTCKEASRSAKPTRPGFSPCGAVENLAPLCPLYAKFARQVDYGTQIPNR